MLETRLLTLLLLPAMPSALALPAVHVINNGTNGDLQTAIQNAAEGDTILLHGGSYSVVSINAKSLTLVAEPLLSASITELNVNLLASGQRCVLSGLDLAGFDRAALAVGDCNGSVRVEDCRLRGLAHVAEPGALLYTCSDVAFVRCTFEGGSEHTSGGPGDYALPAASGLWAWTSQVAIYDSTLTGGAGSYWFGTGASAVQAAAATVFLARCTLTGGRGGDGLATCACIPEHPCPPCGYPPSPGSNGGVGAEVLSASNVSILDCLLAGGSFGLGGSGGMCCGTTYNQALDGQPGATSSGPLSVLSGTSPVMTAPSIVREGATLNLSVSGTPGDTAVLAFASSTHWSFDAALAGVVLYGAPFRRVPLGTIPPNGTLQTSLPVAALPAGVDAQSKFLQVATRTGGGPFRLGSPSWLTILDSSY